VREAQNRERAYLYAATITTGLVIGSHGGFWYIISSVSLLLTAVLFYLSVHSRTSLRPNLSIYYEEAINKLLDSEILTAEHLCGGLSLRTLVAEKSLPKTPREKALIWSSIPLYGSAALLSVAIILIPSLPLLAESFLFQWGFIVGICILAGIGAPLLYRYFRGVTHVNATQPEIDPIQDLKPDNELKSFIPLLAVLEYRNTLGELRNMNNGAIRHNFLGLLLSSGLFILGHFWESWSSIFLTIPFTCFMINLVLYSEIETRIWVKYQKQTEKSMETILGSEVSISKLVHELGSKGIITEIRSAISLFCLTTMYVITIIAFFNIISSDFPQGVNMELSIIYLVTSMIVPLIPLSRLTYFSKLALPDYVKEYS